MSAINTAIEDDCWNDLNVDDPQLQKLLDDPLPQENVHRLRTSEQHAGFDNNAGTTWIYPNNLPCRSYQYSITQSALYRNTLVVLPTGLGKTFIAAVVMYNLYRWYPTGKVIFMAPTRPLVAQQIAACQHIMPFPLKDSVELTGKLPKLKRAELWRTKRVIFATPQVVQSDILSDDIDFPFAAVKLLVIDEAHKAKGRYAYTEVTQTIFQRNHYFRVLALSATPGRTVEDVAEVCRNLLISHLEVRWDTSIDVLPYVHQRKMRTITVPMGLEICSLREQLLEIIDPYLRQLIDADVLSGSLTNINRNFLLYEQKRFRERSQRERHPQYSMISSNFSVCISLYHALELLERHGMRVFLNNFEEDDEGRAKFVLNLDRRLRSLVDELKTQLGPNPFDITAQPMTNGEITPMPTVLDFGHPKFEQARSCILEHFQANSESRAIVFCEYRESVMLIYRLLLQHVPLLRPRCFVGQGGGGSSSSGIRALTQKQQIQIMSDFRSGKSNILVATSIGEEGIDVGEVELIVCFDISTSNPTRFIQRIGRTGRKKNGNVIMLVTEGREAQLLKEVLANRDQINRKLLRSNVVRGALYNHAPRLVPTEYNPQCVQTFIKPDVAIATAAKETTSSKQKRVTKKLEQNEQALKGSQDLRKFFKQPTPALNSDELAIFQVPTQAPSTQTQRNTERSLNKIKNYFEELNVPKITSNTQMVEVDGQRLRKINKILQTNKPLIDESLSKADLSTQLKCETLSKEIKLLLLGAKVDFVRETRDQMKVLQALEMSSANMTALEQNIRATYELLVSVFGDTLKLDDFIEEKTQVAALTTQNDAEFGGIYERIFEGLDDQGICCDNFDYIQEELKKTQHYKDMISQKSISLAAESMVYDTIMMDTSEQSEIEDTDFSRTESKYQSQWPEMAKNDVQPSSTPVKRNEDVIRCDNLAEVFKRQRKKSGSGGNTLLEKLDEKRVEKQNVIDFNYSVQQANSFNYNSTPNKSNVKFNQTITTPNVDISPAQFSKLRKTNSSTPLPELKTTTTHKSQKYSHVDMLSELDNDMDVFLEPLDAYEQAKGEPKTSSSGNKSISSATKRANVAAIATTTTTPTVSVSTVTKTNVTNDLFSELDIDLNDFLEPFPEENMQTYAPPTTKRNATDNTLATSSQKENMQSNLVVAHSTNENLVENRCSPDLFSETISPLKLIESAIKPKISLAAKLAVKSKLNAVAAVTAAAAAQPTNSTRTTTAPTSPQGRATIAPTKYEKSPSVFDIYMRTKRGRLKMPQALIIGSVQRTNKSPKAEDSPIVRRHKSNAKRKIIDSDSDKDDVQEVVDTLDISSVESDDNVETDFEEIPSSQVQRETFRQKRINRRKYNSFIDGEAGVSGDDGSDEEAEHTIGRYMKDSVIISSDDASDVEASQTNVQAMYLQSLKSPLSRPGAFKMPTYRVYNDESHIYSQPVLDYQQSQYLPDSFVVSGDEHDETRSSDKKARDVSFCPLERAERILKERRRKRRHYAEVGQVVSKAKKMRVQRITESSDDDDLDD